MNNLCHRTDGLSFPIELRQTGVDRFTVIYGKQRKLDLDYAAAALEYGSCIMHALACEGKLNNSERRR